MRHTIIIGFLVLLATSGIARIVSAADAVFEPLDYSDSSVDKLIGIMSGDSIYDRRIAAQELGGRGEAAVPVIARLLADDSPRLRRSATEAAAKLEELSEPLVPQLIDILLHDADPYVAAGAAGALKMTGLRSDQIDQALLGAASREHFWVRTAVCDALDWRKKRSALSDKELLVDAALVAMAHTDTNSCVSRIAVTLLQRHGSTEDLRIVPALSKMLMNIEQIMFTDGIIKQTCTIIVAHGDDGHAAIPSMLHAMDKLGPHNALPIMAAFTQMGPAASEALPVLRRYADEEEFRRIFYPDSRPEHDRNREKLRVAALAAIAAITAP